MEIIQYIRLFRKWLWLIGVLAIIGGGIAYVTSEGSRTVYRSQITISIGNFVNNPNPNLNQVRFGIEFGPIYELYVRTDLILERTIDALDLDMSVGDLRGQVQANALVDAPMMIIEVTSTESRQEAARIVTGLAEQLLLASPTNLSREEAEEIAFLEDQMSQIGQQLEDDRERVQEINNELDTLDVDSPRAVELRLERNDILDNINQATANLASFSASAIDIRNRSNALSIFDAARTSRRFEGISRVNATVIGTVIGAIFAIGAILLLEYFNDTLRNSVLAARVLRLPVLSTIVRFGPRFRRGQPAKRLIMLSSRRSPAVEGYRTLRSNLLSSMEPGDKGIFMVTSPRANEGKSVTVANLAVAMTFDNMRVLAIDTSMIHPTLHEFFNLGNETGLSTLMSSEPVTPDDDALQKFKTENDPSGLPEVVRQTIQPTSVNGLWVLPAGFIPSNATEMLSSKRMNQWIHILRECYGFDFLLIDSSPLLATADSSSLASTIDPEVLLLVDCRQTAREAALKARELLDQLEIPVKGLVANRVNPSDESYVYSRVAQSRKAQQAPAVPLG